MMTRLRSAKVTHPEKTIRNANRGALVAPPSLPAAEIGDEANTVLLVNNASPLCPARSKTKVNGAGPWTLRISSTAGGNARDMESLSGCENKASTMEDNEEADYVKDREI